MQRLLITLGRLQLRVLDIAFPFKSFSVFFVVVFFSNYSIRLNLIHNLIVKLPFFCPFWFDWLVGLFPHLLCALGPTWQQEPVVPASFPGPSGKEKRRKTREKHKTKREHKHKKEKVINLNKQFIDSLICQSKFSIIYARL